MIRRATRKGKRSFVNKMRAAKTLSEKKRGRAGLELDQREETSHLVMWMPLTENHEANAWNHREIRGEKRRNKG